MLLHSRTTETKITRLRMHHSHFREGKRKCFLESQGCPCRARRSERLHAGVETASRRPDQASQDPAKTTSSPQCLHEDIIRAITQLNRHDTSRTEKPMVRATKSGIFSPDMGHCPSRKVTYCGLRRTVKLSPKTPDGK